MHHCLPCTQKRSNDLFTPNTVTRVGATTPVECLNKYGQMNDGAFWVPLSSDEGVTVTQGVGILQACVDLCSAQQECQLVTYDYTAQTCTVRVWLTPIYEG